MKNIRTSFIGNYFCICLAVALAVNLSGCESSGISDSNSKSKSIAAGNYVREAGGSYTLPTGKDVCNYNQGSHVKIELKMGKDGSLTDNLYASCDSLAIDNMHVKESTGTWSVIGDTLFQFGTQARRYDPSNDTWSTWYSVKNNYKYEIISVSSDSFTLNETVTYGSDQITVYKRQ